MNDELKNFKENGIDFENNTFNLDKLSGLNGFHNLLKEIDFDLHSGSKQKKLIDFIRNEISIAKKDIENKIDSFSHRFVNLDGKSVEIITIDEIKEILKKSRS